MPVLHHFLSAMNLFLELGTQLANDTTHATDISLGSLRMSEASPRVGKCPLHRLRSDVKLRV
jgi:hypothetical protein